MEGAALLERLTPVLQRAPGAWQIGTVAAIHTETPRVKSFRISLPSWIAHLPGQHYEVRLTAPDGYRAQRSYSIASSPLDEGEVELTVSAVGGDVGAADAGAACERVTRISPPASRARHSTATTMTNRTRVCVSGPEACRPPPIEVATLPGLSLVKSVRPACQVGRQDQMAAVISSIRPGTVTGPPVASRT